jgi:hypothetical protein
MSDVKWTQKHSENLANQGRVILPPELRKNALLISQSDSSNFALYIWLLSKILSLHSNDFFQIVKYPRIPGSHSSENISDIVRPPPSGPVKVVTTGGNVPTQPVSRPVRLHPGNRSPRTNKRQSAEFAAQLTGKGPYSDAPRSGQGTVPY